MTAIPQAKVTPMMAQWHACKKMAKEAILLFRMGDFYEAFYEDATALAKELNLTLTQRQGIPMSGIPVHTIDNYVDRLIGKGFRVAIAEQMEDPKKTKGLVKREVTRVVTPGSVVNSSLIHDKENNYFAALERVGAVFGFAYIDVTTGEFRIVELEDERELLNEIFRLRPAEFISSAKFKEKQNELLNEITQSYNALINTQEDWHFDHQMAYEFLVGHFKVHSLDGFGLKGMVAGINAAGALLRLLQEELQLPIDHVREIKSYTTTEYMSLDRITQRNLELTESLQDGSRKNTLLDVLDRTATPMGGRLIRRWIKQPLLSVEAIKGRQDAISTFVKAPHRTMQLKGQLSQVRDLERLIVKISSGFASPKDLVALRTSLEQLPALEESLEGVTTQLLAQARNNLKEPNGVAAKIGEALVDDPPLRVSDGNLFRKGYHAELDELRSLCRDGKSWLANYQVELRESTGIKTLKVGFNRVFGYYIEVSRGQSAKMPVDFQRRQTLANSERFISPLLKEYETKVLTAEEKISSLETSLYNELRLEIAQYGEEIKKIAQAVALIDLLFSLAEVAREYGFSRPEVNESNIFEVRGGRHPVIEKALLSETFIPNDTFLDDDKERLFIITGPNMAGKSTYIRQVALIAIMAQMGSFIPAASAKIGIVDKVFTRIGASDDLSRGQSTFMVEMTETANILNNVTSRSLVILDEIGRGTSTYDGISIAWSVAEYLLKTVGKQAKTLFATHYWELTKLQEQIPGAVNYNVAVKEGEEGIVFLHKIVKGGTDKSYGIHVARLAGLPQQVIRRSKEILVHLEKNANRKESFQAPKREKVFATKATEDSKEVQLVLFEPQKKRKVLPHQDIIDAIKKIDVENTTPMQAHTTLADLKKLLKTHVS